MKKATIKVLSFIICGAILFSGMFGAYAADSAFSQEAYTNLVTFSDCQHIGPVAYNNFGRILRVMKNDGMPEPDALLVGGDYSLLLNDYATLGAIQLREHYASVYEDGDRDDIICVQGNHDMKIAAFYPTGMYDMGTYCLYIINEDDYPWRQGSDPANEEIVKSTAAAIEKSLNEMIDSGDRRPVILITHVPLHFTKRSSYGDDLYSSYIFNVINKAAQTLDIIFLFGHNHSGDYDDYIGGSVNFMAPGDTVFIPTPDKRGEGCYTEETLNFTYTNCGYIGFDLNHNTGTSVNVITLGAIRFFSDKLVFLKYSKDGLFRTDTVERKNIASAEDMGKNPTHITSQRNDEEFWAKEKSFFEPVISFIVRLFNLFYSFTSSIGSG